MRQTLARIFDENNICMIKISSWRQYMLWGNNMYRKFQHKLLPCHFYIRGLVFRLGFYWLFNSPCRLKSFICLPLSLVQIPSSVKQDTLWSLLNHPPKVVFRYVSMWNVLANDIGTTTGIVVRTLLSPFVMASLSTIGLVGYVTNRFDKIPNCW